MNTTYIRFHWFAVLVTVVIGLLFGGRHIISIYELGWGPYQPITFASLEFQSTDGFVYNVPRAKAVYEGQMIPGDVNVVEYKDAPSVLPILGPIIVGSLGRLFGSFKAGVIATDFLFPALSFFLFYVFVFSV